MSLLVQSGPHHGDISLGDTVDIKFNTTDVTGAPLTLGGVPVISAYVDNSVTEITAGITLTVDFDGRTGLHNARVVASGGNGFAVSTNVHLVITTGTLGAISAVGAVVGAFSIENRSALRPATPGRELVVDAAGLADANAVKVGPTGSGTAQTAGDIMADTNDIQARLPAALTADGNIKADSLRHGGTLQTAGDIVVLLNTIDDFVDTEVAAIKAKTDLLNAGIGSTIQADIRGINNVANAAVIQEKTLREILPFTISSAASITGFTATDLPAGLDANALVDRVVIFEGNTTTQLAGAPRRVATQTGQAVTFAALPRTCAVGDRGVIV